MRAADAAGNLSPYSTIATATTAAALDTTPPTAPTALTATAAGATQINLDWTASSDNVGVSGYRVERCQGAGCTNFAQVGTPTGTSFSDTGLSASTTYRYQVRAADAAGNLSPYSTIATATTAAALDTTPPTAPTALTATAAGATQINLNWTASSDNVGVTGYRVERCQGSGCTNFAQVGTPTGTSFNDTGRSASTTYRYQVRAADAAGNLEPVLDDRHRDHRGGAGHDAADGADGADRDGGRRHPDQPQLDRVERQRRGLRIPRGALPGRGLHQLRPGRDADRHVIQRHRPVGLDHLPVPGARDRCGRQPQRLLRHSRGDDRRGSAAPSGLVGGWAFGEGVGTTTVDASGNGNTGTITGRHLVDPGPLGNALSFNGTNSVVRVPSSASLNLTTGMTLCLDPADGQPERLADNPPAPGRRLLPDRQLRLAGPSRGRRDHRRRGPVHRRPDGQSAQHLDHVALTYDGATLRLYVNGTQVASHAAGGTMQTTTNPLWIGGNNPYGEYFRG